MKSIIDELKKKAKDDFFDDIMEYGHRRSSGVIEIIIDDLVEMVAREVARDYEGRIEFEDRLIDNMCMQLIQCPGTMIV